MANKILENWEEIERVENLVREQKGDPRAGFNANSFFLGGNGRHLAIPCLYRTKKIGSDQYTQTYKEIMCIAKFCPFTGKPLYEDSVVTDDKTK